MTPEMQSLVEIVAQVGSWVIFLTLFMYERRDHAETRKSLYKELETARLDHMNDLREIANMRQQLYRVQQNVADFHQEQRRGDTGRLPDLSNGTD